MVTTHAGASLELRRLAHRGELFEVHEGLLDGRHVAVKLPRRKPLTVLEANWSFIFTRIFSQICVGGRRTTLQHGRAQAASLLLAESEAIAASRGTWNHDGSTERVDWPKRPNVPVLISSFRDGDRLCDLSSYEQQRLLPRMLPSLWRALATALHGDLNPANIIVWPERDRFSLIDPGVCIRRSGGGRSCPRVEIQFTTTPSAYPLIPPYHPTTLASGSGAPLSAWLAELLATMGQARRTWQAGERTIGQEFVVGGFLSDVPRERSSPHPADLLALGILYYQALTGIHPLFEGSFTEPAWMGLRLGDGAVLDGAVEPVFERLERPIIPPSVRNPAVTRAEDELVLALLELRIADLDQLADLAFAAARSLAER